MGTLNPHKEEGVELVLEMLRQVVALHPGLSTIHIGADEVRTCLWSGLLSSVAFKDAFLLHLEVYLLGEGEESKQWLASSGRTVEELFLSHVTKVAKAIKEMWPQLTIIMWDDMMRGMSQDTLKGEEKVQVDCPNTDS